MVGLLKPIVLSVFLCILATRIDEAIKDYVVDKSYND